MRERQIPTRVSSKYIHVCYTRPAVWSVRTQHGNSTLPTTAEISGW